MPQKQDTTRKDPRTHCGKSGFSQGPIFYQTKLHATSCIRFKASGFSAGKDHHAMNTDSHRSECYTYFTLRVCEQLMEISHPTQPKGVTGKSVIQAQ